MGENGERFIGQSVGPFVLPCHMTKEFGEFRERFDNDEPSPHCVGAQIYRANIGVSHLLPEQATGEKVPTDYDTVFGGHDELLSHHRGITIEEAKQLLKETSPLEHLEGEMRKRTAAYRLLRNNP